MYAIVVKRIQKQSRTCRWQKSQDRFLCGTEFADSGSSGIRIEP